MQYTKQDLIDLLPHHSSIVCIDSDGCVFNSMDVKQKDFFHGLIIKHWGLESIEPIVRETAEFVNLYSKWRGTNRFIALRKVFELLVERPEFKESGLEIEDFSSMTAFIESGAPLGNPSLEEEVEKTGDASIKKWLDWSKAVNTDINTNMHLIPPFDDVKKSLEMVQEYSDAIVVSQTPTESIVKEWNENGISQYVSIIAGQELGTKTEHIQMAAEGKYKGNDILMIGDAPGDLKAAQANNALFFPINPGHEDASWENFHKEAYKKFVDHTFEGDYQKQLISEFEALLPETPPWQI
ncbi:hypothetical protein BVX97_02900 [bacterium E08(2017)]|nr:hypothetical protein BVX97_02900 [bacterium E08(2017)]